jgi:hypothetical protein
MRRRKKKKRKRKRKLPLLLSRIGEDPDRKFTLSTTQHMLIWLYSVQAKQRTSHSQLP